MPYIVQPVQHLYDEAQSSRHAADLIGEFLSKQETDGFRLVAVLPDHQLWDDKGSQDGLAPSMLILHREEPI